MKYPTVSRVHPCRRSASLFVGVVASVLGACGGDDTAAVPDASVSVDAASTPDASTLTPDPCPATPPACPTAPGGFARGDGLLAIDRCAFPLSEESETWTERDAIIDMFPATMRTSLADITSDLNRAATTVAPGDVAGTAPGIRTAFTWQAGDNSVTYWIPQGITGSFDANPAGTVAGRKLVLVSWYYEIANEQGSTAEKGVRIAIVDVTNPSAIAYRFALLVEPVMRAGRPDFAPIVIHAGGLAWVGDLLYVPVTGSGFRVFDLSRILRVDGTTDRLGYDTASGTYDAHGYKYVIPQLGTYVETGACNAVFSYVALDRTSSPPSLISGEYSSTTVTGRIYRWPLDTATSRLALTDQQRVIGDGAWFAGESHVQGALAHDDTFWMSSSQPAGGAGALYRARVGTPSATLGWIDTPEDVAYDPQDDTVWSLSEVPDERFVIAVRRDAID